MNRVTPDCESCGAKEEGFYKFDGRHLCEPCMLEEEYVKEHGMWPEEAA